MFWRRSLNDYVVIEKKLAGPTGNQLIIGVREEALDGAHLCEETLKLEGEVRGKVAEGVDELCARMTVGEE